MDVREYAITNRNLVYGDGTIIVCENNSLSGMRAAGVSDARLLYRHTTTMNYAGGSNILNNKRTRGPLCALRQPVYLLTLGGSTRMALDRSLRPQANV